MDILSKDTLKIISDENVRKGVDKILTPSESEQEVTVTTHKSSCGSGKKGESQNITIRRLSV